MQLNKRSVLVVGDVMLDKWVYLQSVRSSPETNVPIVRVENEFIEMGGAGNAVRHLANLSDGSHGLIGVVGADSAGKKLIEVSKSAGASTQLLIDAKRLTTAKDRYFLDNIPIYRHDSEVLDDLDEQIENEILSSIRESISSKDSILLSDYAKGVLSQGLVSRVISLAKSLKIPIISDPGLGRIQIHAGCDIIKPNAKEWFVFVEQMGSETSALSMLFSKGTKSVIITQGSSGIRLVERDIDIFNPAENLMGSTDVTGAGDSVAAALSLLVDSKGFAPELLPILNRIGGQTVAKSRTELPSGIEMDSYLSTVVVDPGK